MYERSEGASRSRRGASDARIIVEGERADAPPEQIQDL